MSLFCGVAFGVLSILAIILLRKRKLVALLYLCCSYLYFTSLPYGAAGGPSLVIVLFVCLFDSFTSHQKSFSNVGTGRPGLNQY